MPPGLLSIAAYLREKGETVDIVDLNVIKRQVHTEGIAKAFRNRLEQTQPILVGVSVMVAGQFKHAKEICKQAKQVLPNVLTVVGGAHVSQFPKDILKNFPEIDFVVMGEGEMQAYECAQYAKKRIKPSVWPDGLAYRSGDRGDITVLPKIQYIYDVNRLPLPAYDLLDFEDYRHDTRTWHNPYQVDLSLRVPIITSRGCPNTCNFCSVAECMGLTYRAMSVSNVVDLLQMLYEKRGAYYFAIFDANFAQNPSRVIEISNEIIKRNLKIILDLPTGLPINATAPEMVDALADAGLIRTCISVESGDDFIRNKVMIKNIYQNDIFMVVEAIRRHPQIYILTDFVIGMPEDTEETLETSCEIIADLDIDNLYLCVATPYPGTKLYEQCVKDNLFLPDIRLDHLYEADWYCHDNVNKFSIKPYSLDLNTLCAYRDRILAMRKEKIFKYHKRMKTYFNIDVPSGSD
jgi:radical SAM superfamily enzyme YgiQ (UPF0313 family)